MAEADQLTTQHCHPLDRRMNMILRGLTEREVWNPSEVDRL